MGGKKTARQKHNSTHASGGGPVESTDKMPPQGEKGAISCWAWGELI